MQKFEVNMIQIEIKKLLLDNGVTLKELAEQMTKRLGKNCSLSNLSKKLKNQTITYKDVELIADILGYELEFKRK